MKRKALFVGVNEYEDPQIRNLNYSLSDAHALKTTLFELFGYHADVLENPSKSDVFRAVKEMTGDLSAGDLFFFYFAGHGWTTTTGKHLLFCSDDMYEDLRDDDAGISFEKLKRKTTGEYNRAFVLDACRSDFITGTRGGDETTRDLRPIGELVNDAPAKSSLAVLRSCSKYEHALEIESRKHGLFTLAMMDVLRSSKEVGVELFFGESLCDAVTQKMSVIARAEGIAAAQTPEFAKSGIAQVLFSGRKEIGQPSITSPSTVPVACPDCGAYNLIVNMFKCKVCGRDHLCKEHFSNAGKCCLDCAAQRKNERVSKAYVGDGTAPECERKRIQLWAEGPYWADRNIGAEEPEDYGYYFWWGDTMGYTFENGVWSASDGSKSGFVLNVLTWKNTNELRNGGWITARGVLVPEHDAAHVHWSGDWRMPTGQELSNLCKKCDWTWTTINGVSGHMVRGKGDYVSASIFLPCAGIGNGTSLYHAGSYGRFWSSVPRSGNDYAWYLYFNSSYHGTCNYGNYRYSGQSVRPVQGFTK